MGGKTKTKTKTDNSIDPFSKAQYLDGKNRVQGILDANPYQTYNGVRVASSSDAETDALNNYQASTGQVGGMLQNAMGVANQFGQNRTGPIETRQLASTDLTPYMNPYTEEVIDRSISDMDRARKMAVTSTEAGQHSSAFGGSRHGVSDALTNERFIDQVGNVAAGLRDKNFSAAMGYAGYDLSNANATDQFNKNMDFNYDQGRLSQAGVLAQLANQYGSRADQEASMLTMLGGNQRAIEQAGLDAEYQEFLRAQEDPYRRAQMQLGLLGTTPMITDSVSTGSQKTNPGALGIIGTLAQAYGAVKG